MIYSGQYGGPVLNGWYSWASQALVARVTSGVVTEAAYLCCVVEGTMISTSPSSSVAVETLAVSDSVVSKDISLFDDDMTAAELRTWSGSNINGSASTALVTANTLYTTSAVLNFNGTLRTSKSHTHIVKRGTEWFTKPASDVLVGDYFENESGSLVEITTITQESGSFNVYALNVETDDVYYANGILTHNVK